MNSWAIFRIVCSGIWFGSILCFCEFLSAKGLQPISVQNACMSAFMLFEIFHAVDRLFINPFIDEQLNLLGTV